MSQPDPHVACKEQRRRMVDDQLRHRGIGDERVLLAMQSVPREEFVPLELRSCAYDDRPLSIGQGQTISQPYTVASMVEALQLLGGERVLEIGTGSGYCAAVLSRIAGQVCTIERVSALAESAAERLNRLGYNNISVIQGDGTQGLPGHATFDGILVTAGAPSLPVPLFQQLSPGGRLVIPIGSSPRRQVMHRFTRRPEGLIDEQLGTYAFVPLIGRHGWNESDVNSS